ncbi:head-tail adaptor protein [Paracoccus sp. YIM 132242]|uniref:Head-tail adaptor protein n=1 Tax=Paracoccus lichenicola TaxID=2665644 RepID=A0A6L6HI17_9RHOB|nr:head-tail adaptor protein [Paracoccus lichenicola]MTD98793.1 head-tail adaptor protein [Paracoccus lichenicola]
MRAGKLQARIQIEREQEAVSDNGLVRQVWLPVLTTRAEIKEATTTEFLTGQIEGNQNKVVFLIRWPSQPISTGDRLTHNGAVWNITGLSEIGRKRGLEIRAEAVA